MAKIGTMHPIECRGARITNSAHFQLLQPTFDDIPFRYIVMSIVTARRKKKHLHAKNHLHNASTHFVNTFCTVSYDCSASSFVCWQDNLTAIGLTAAKISVRMKGGKYLRFLSVEPE